MSFEGLLLLLFFLNGGSKDAEGNSHPFVNKRPDVAFLQLTTHYSRAEGASVSAITNKVTDKAYRFS